MSGAGPLFLGCAEKPKPTWMARPAVYWTDIASENVPPVVDGFRLLTTGPTQGLFPAALAVSRVSITNSPKPQGRDPELLTDPRNEFLQWNSAFDDLMAVSEVFPIAERTLGGGQAEPKQILAAFRALHARLGLIYAVNEPTELEAEMIAVLYDLKADRPIACLHARSQSKPPPESESKSKKPVNLWDTAARALVRKEFEKLAHACVRELTLQDEPAALEDKSGWTPETPVRPVEWPPHTSSRNRP
jgi:hypothetical protein